MKQRHNTLSSLGKKWTEEPTFAQIVKIKKKSTLEKKTKQTRKQQKTTWKYRRIARKCVCLHTLLSAPSLRCRQTSSAGEKGHSLWYWQFLIVGCEPWQAGFRFSEQVLPHLIAMLLWTRHLKVNELQRTSVISSWHKLGASSFKWENEKKCSSLSAAEWDEMVVAPSHLASCLQLDCVKTRAWDLLFLWRFSEVTKQRGSLIPEHQTRLSHPSEPNDTSNPCGYQMFGQSFSYEVFSLSSWLVHLGMG